MYPVFGINFEWFLVIIIAVIGMIVQARLQSVFAKYSKITFHGGLTGSQVSEKMLRDNGIRDVTVQSTAGKLTDNFNPRNKTINLSEPVYNTNSVAAAAVAAHETGHAIQHATGYGPLKMRAALVPVISFTSKWSLWVIIIGAVVINTFPELFWIGIGMVAASTLFSLITLPVEFNASARAMQWLRRSDTLTATELTQARTALKWAACTYVVAALSGIATLLYYISIARRR